MNPPIATFRGADLDPALVSMLAASALPAEAVTTMQLEVVDRDTMAGLVGDARKAAKIPYLTLAGSPTGFSRYRFLEDPPPSFAQQWGQKSRRYTQAKGTRPHAYFPPFADWEAIASDADTPVILTEGEKKAACATYHGMPCIGLGGVDSFASKKDDTPLLPELMEFKWKGRQVAIVYDSDADTNPNVMAASIRLGRKLALLGAYPKIAKLSATRDGSKQGLDDFVLAAIKDGGTGAQAIASLLAEASDKAFEREAALMDFNSRFVYIRNMDRVVVRDDLAFLEPGAFANRAYASETYRNAVIKRNKDGEVTQQIEIVPTAKAWLIWEGRLTKKELDFNPTEGELTEHAYNTWRGWKLAPKKGNVQPWHDLLDRLFGPDDANARRWLECWLAYPLQHPGAKLKTAVLLWSRAEGNGKSTVMETMRAIYGECYVPMNDSAVDLVYTDWLVNKLFVGVDDIAARNRDDHAAKWKNLITSPRLTVQKKYTPSFEITSRVNFMMTSNEPNALRLSPNDRRNFIHEARTWGTQEEREAFFGAYYKWLDTGGAAALLDYFLGLDLSVFDPDANALMTNSKMEMQDVSKGTLEKWLQDVYDAPDAMLTIGAAKQKGDLWTSEDLTALYNAQPFVKTQITSVTMGMALTGFGFPKAYKGNQIRMKKGVRKRMFILRNHGRWEEASAEACREHYEETRE